jgi:hypothetical protein
LLPSVLDGTKPLFRVPAAYHRLRGSRLGRRPSVTLGLQLCLARLQGLLDRLSLSLHTPDRLFLGHPLMRQLGLQIPDGVLRFRQLPLGLFTRHRQRSNRLSRRIELIGTRGGSGVIAMDYRDRHIAIADKPAKRPVWSIRRGCGRAGFRFRRPRVIQSQRATHLCLGRTQSYFVARRICHVFLTIRIKTHIGVELSIERMRFAR